MKKKKVIGAVVAVAIIAIAIGVSSGGSKKENSSSEDKQTQTSKVSAKVVTFEQMVKAYSENGVTADDKYKGKELQFTGTVKTVTAGVLSGSDVSIDAGNFTDNQFESTTATVNVDNNVAKKIKSGQTYTFVAKGSGGLVTDGWVSHLNFVKGTIK